MAWDDIKQNGQTLTGPEYNAMVADQKNRLAKPSVDGSPGNVLALDGSLTPTWVAAPSGGSGEIEISSLREKLDPENNDWVLIEDSRSGGYKRVKVGNLRR